MSETLNDLEVIQTDTKTYRIVVVDDNNAPIDITGYLLFFTVKTSLSDLDVDALIQETVTCPDNTDSEASIGFITLSSTQTNVASGNYSYDIKIQSDSSITFRKTVVSGKFKVNTTATKRTS